MHQGNDCKSKKLILANTQITDEGRIIKLLLRREERGEKTPVKSADRQYHIYVYPKTPPLKIRSILSITI